MPSICSLSMHVLTCKPTSSQGNRCVAPPCPSSPLAPRVARLSFLVLECPVDRQPLLPSRIAGHPMRGAACSGDGGAGSAAGRQQGPDRCVGAGLWPAGPVQLVQEALGVDLGSGEKGSIRHGDYVCPQPMRLGAAPAAAAATACAAAAFQLSQTELRHPQSTIHEPHATPFQARPPCGPTRSS